MTRNTEFLVRCIYAATQVTLRLLAADEDDAKRQAAYRQQGALFYSAWVAPDRCLRRSPWAK